MKVKLTGTLLAAAIVGACGTQPRDRVAVWTPLPFDEAEYAALPKTGTGVVRGRVSARLRDGQTRNGAGEEVLLIPATTFRDQWYIEKLMQHKSATHEQDPRYSRYDRRQVADASGRFEFTEVPPGPYYVLGRVVWSEAVHGASPPAQELQGGLVIRKVQVQNGRISEVSLTYE